MKIRILTIATLLLFVFAAAPAGARDVRHPQTGNPAFTFHVPDDWTTRVDADGNMLVGAADHLSALSLSIVEYHGTLDDVAAGAMQVAQAAPPRRAAATNLSGYGGYTYFSTITNPSGTHVNLKMIAVQLDASHVATCTLLFSDAITPASLATANVVLASMALTAHP